MKPFTNTSEDFSQNWHVLSPIQISLLISLGTLTMSVNEISFTCMCLFPTTSQNLVSTVLHVSVAGCGHLQGAVMYIIYILTLNLEFNNNLNFNNCNNTVLQLPVE
jgi:hypothetical protein